MGFYLDSKKPSSLYTNETVKPYFVDKTKMIDQLIPFVYAGSNYICITRPRRFGKTVMANMISAFFGKVRDTSEVFKKLAISQSENYRTYLNQYHVISITFNEVPKNCKSYEQYISRIEKLLAKDLMDAYPVYHMDPDDAVWDILSEIFENEDAKFIFVLDEWDYIFHQDFISEQDKVSYIRFLSNLLKDKPYVSFAYMTGILPIAKYSSGSELNMFVEFTMANEPKFSDFFGFTESEVDMLYARYCENMENPQITREELKEWYDGYSTKAGERIYNPRSVVASLTNNNLGNYWTSSGPYDEIFYYIKKNIADIRKDLALMVSGEAVPVRISEYAATSMDLSTREEIFSAMVVYGFLSYENGFVSIPNKELMGKFCDMLQKESSLGYIYQLAKSSEKMLKATWNGDTKTMVEILELVHNTEVPLLSYNNEAELTAVVNLVYLSARDFYRIEREDKAGIGYVDFIFYPETNRNADCIILELKVDHTPEEAIQQIKDKQYARRFLPKIGEELKYTGRILAVGISYDRDKKKHSCRIEILRG